MGMLIRWAIAQEIEQEYVRRGNYESEHNQFEKGIEDLCEGS